MAIRATMSACATMDTHNRCRRSILPTAAVALACQPPPPQKPSDRHHRSSLPNVAAAVACRPPLPTADHAILKIVP